MMMLLLEADDADNQGYGIDVLVWEFEGVVLWVVGNDEDVLLVRSWLYALDDCALYRIEDVGFVPLKE